MTSLKWTSKALSDLTRLYDFLAPANRTAAAKTVQALVTGPQILLTIPRICERLDEFDPREVRRILVGRYEVRYELDGQIAHILRIWHTREER